MPRGKLPAFPYAGIVGFRASPAEAFQRSGKHDTAAILRTNVCLAGECGENQTLVEHQCARAGKYCR